MKRLLLAGSVLAALTTGCAYVGAAGLAVWLQDNEDDGEENRLPAASSDYAVAVSPTMEVTLFYQLHDPEGDPADVDVEYAAGGTAAYAPCTEFEGAGSEGKTSLATSPEGTPHLFVWDAPSDLAGYNRTVTVRIAPRESAGGRPGASHVFPPFTWRPDAGPDAAVADPGTSFGNVPIAYTLADPESNPADIQVAYSIDGGASFHTASEAPSRSSEGLTALAALSSGSTHEFLWNAFADAGGLDRTVQIRISPTDAVTEKSGTAALSPPFSLLNARVVTVAGVGTESFGRLAGVAADARGVVYVSETYGHRIWALNAGGAPATVAGSILNPRQGKAIAGTGLPGYDGDYRPALQARLHTPAGLAADAASPPNLYVADAGNHRVRKIDGRTGYITTLTGTGTAGDTDEVPASQGELDTPLDVAVGASGAVFIADTGNHVVRAVNLDAVDLRVGHAVVAPGEIHRVCGVFSPSLPYDGDGDRADQACLDGPAGVALDASGNLLVSDTGNHRVRAVNAADPALGSSSIRLGAVTIGAGDIDTVAGSGTQGFAGDGGPAPAAALDAPAGLQLLSNGVLLFAEGGNHAVRALHTGAPGSAAVSVGTVVLQPECIDTVAGTGTVRGDSGDGSDASLSTLDTPSGVAQACGAVFIAGNNRRLRAFNPSGAPDGVGVTVAGVTLSPGVLDTLYASPGHPLSAPAALALHWGDLFIAGASGHVVLRLDPSAGTATRAAGTGAAGFSGDGGPAPEAAFSSPQGLAIDPFTGTLLAVSDTGNDRVRLVHIAPSAGGQEDAFGVTVDPGEVQTIPAPVGQVTGPTALAFGPSGALFVADTGGNRIVKIERSGVLSQVAGPSEVSSPSGLAVDGVSGDLLLVSDTGNDRIRAVHLDAGGSAVTAFGVTVNPGAVVTIPSSSGAVLSPGGLSPGPGGDLWIADTGSHRVLRLARPDGSISVEAGGGAPGFNGDGIEPLFTLFDGPQAIGFDGNRNLYVADRDNGRVRRFRIP